jgi:general secretion pathway protein L
LFSEDYRATRATTLMDVSHLFQRWIAVLVATFFAWRDAWRAQRSLVITCADDRFIVRKGSADRDGIAGPTGEDEQEQGPVLAVLAAGETVSAELSHAARHGSVILEIPGENVVIRRLAVPAQAREFAAGIVRNQIDRLSPWHSGQAVYAFVAETNAEDAATLDVRVLLASRDVVDGVRAQITAMGISVDRVVASLSGVGGTKAVPVWSRLADVSPEHERQIRRRTGIGIAAAVAASFAFSLWAMISAQSINGTSEEVTARANALRHQLQAPLTRQSAALLPSGEREWYDKEISPSAVIVIEALSRALPDNAYLTELNLQNTTFRIVGLTNDAPALIAPLEHSRILTDVHFFAPTTREPDGKHFRFSIEGRVQPDVRLAERE